MNNETNERPTAFGAFFRGGMSGFTSGLVMALVIACVAPVLPLLGLGTVGATFMSTLIASGPLMITAATLFGGIMATKRAIFDAPAHTATPRYDIVPVPVQGISAPGIAPEMTFADTAPEQAATKSWVAETGRNEESRTRIQQILADGSLSDKDRASAILASREAADQQASRA